MFAPSNQLTRHVLRCASGPSVGSCDFAGWFVSEDDEIAHKLKLGRRVGESIGAEQFDEPTCQVSNTPWF